jgi:hypothetical protein
VDPLGLSYDAPSDPSSLKLEKMRADDWERQFLRWLNSSDQPYPDHVHPDLQHQSNTDADAFWYKCENERQRRNNIET